MGWMDCNKDKVHDGVMVEQGGLWDMGMGNFSVLYHSGAMGIVHV